MMMLKEGFTTGACAAAAAKAAAMVLCGAPEPKDVEIALPDGSGAIFPVLFTRSSGEGYEAAVCKDAGDDPDVTDGLRVVAHVQFTRGNEVSFAAGEGVGTVRKPGLALPPGEPAINPVPRRMIRTAIADVTGRGVLVRISIPGGKEIAARTFNPRLGIAGGLSILGTTGRVKPFSVPALIESLKCSLAVAAACGVNSPVLVPGNIGERAARKNFRLDPEQVLQVSNQWGIMLDEAARHRFPHILVLGHPGKLAKLAAGEWDTHSARSAGALPIVAGLWEEIFKKPVTSSQTVEGVFRALQKHDRRKLGDTLSSHIQASVSRRLDKTQRPAVALVDLDGEILGSAGDLEPWR